MKTRGWAVLMAALAMAACGGGAGDAGGGNGNGGGGGGGGSGSGDPNGTAEISFPWSNSTATAQTLTIRGIASDPEGVAAVTINGAPATVSAISASAGKSFGKAGQDGDVVWTADVELASGQNELVIAVEDQNGNVSEAADSATITYVEVPVTSTLDPEGTRLVGLSFTLTPTGFVQRLVEHNYETLEQTVYDGGIWPDPALTCFRRFENDFLYLTFFTGTWELRKFNLNSEVDSLLAEIEPAVLDGGDGFAEMPNVAQLVCDSAHTSAYFLANYTDENGNGYRPISAYAKSRIFAIELATGTVNQLSESDTTAQTRWIAQFMALVDTTIVTIEDISPLAPMTSVSLSNGERTFLAPDLDIGGVALDPVLDEGPVYVATLDGVDEVIATQPPSIRNISLVDATDPLVFSQVRSINFDPANNRVIVGDSALDTLIAVDLGTGERSEFVSRKIGAGPPLIAPRQLAISADGTRAYVADDGDNAPERLFEIDLVTGDRRLVGDIAQPSSFFATGLALDEAGGRVFVSFEDVILEVNLETEDVQAIASVDTTVELESMDGLMLDGDNNRLLVGDFVQDAIFALDLDTHAVEAVSQPNVKGSGPAFGGIVSFTKGEGATELYVAGQTSESVTRVDLVTGDREQLAVACDSGLAPPLANLTQVLYNGIQNELFISGDELFSLDLSTGVCNPLQRRIIPFQIGITLADRMLAVTFGALLQRDRETGEVVIISK